MYWKFLSLYKESIHSSCDFEHLNGNTEEEKLEGQVGIASWSRAGPEAREREQLVRN